MSGNPSGRPKGERAFLVAQYGEDAAVLHERLDKLAANKKTPAHVKAEILKFKIERHSGKAPQNVGITGADGQPAQPRRVIIELADASS